MNTIDPMHRRRWFQYGLRELFWLTLIVATASGWAREAFLRQRAQTEANILRGRIDDVSQEAMDTIELAAFYQNEWIKIRARLDRELPIARKKDPADAPLSTH